MGIIDKVTALLPRRSELRRSERREMQPPGQAQAAMFREDLDRWLQRVFEDPWGAGGLEGAPTLNVRETDDEVIVTVEVPGLERDDLDLSISPGGLTIRGQKRTEREEKGKDFYASESRYGSFVHTVPLPPGLDVDRATARVKNGVLTVSFPKVAARAGAHRIPITT
jgi:HSP20 family protein